jgi:hypothetical protein
MPQATIRDCGRSVNTPTALETRALWLDYYPATLGAKVMARVPATLGVQVATGVVTRSAAAPTRTGASGQDLSDPVVESALGLRPPSRTSVQIENYAVRADTTLSPEQFWYLRPSNLRLNFFSGFSATEPDWSITAPKRTTQASAGDTFVRGVVGGLFAGYQIALEFRDTCAVGALSDALGGPALMGDGTPNSGIFSPDRAALVQSVLVANGVVLRIGVIGSKKLPAVESAFATTRCSTANMAACATLVASLAAAVKAFEAAASTPSNLAKLGASTDPVWSPVRLTSAPIAVAP